MPKVAAAKREIKGAPLEDEELNTIDEFL